MFSPKNWGQVDRFAKLHMGSHTFSACDSRALSGVSAHLKKAHIFKSIAEELRSTLEVDRSELNSKGFTTANHAHKLAAVVEAFIVELYSVIDCTAKVLRAVFASSTRGFKDSTSYLFTKTDKISGLPQPIIDEIAAADWYLPLRYLRDELTHLDVGHCSLDDNTGLVSYAHFGMKKDQKPLIYDDIFLTMNRNFDAVNLFLGKVFKCLLTTLGDTPVQLMCGMTHGRMLIRSIVPTEPLSFDNGICQSHQWFELPEYPDCPFAANCGAYRRTKAMQHQDYD
ncbi:hypothetical protein SAMN04488037_10388 [Shimia marina]|uniref:Uncharacterized protein n=2 Tax=Shimia marina TaxID=321267 RepID=A0A0P1ESD0_9RHOB|nr:hypothetical protein SHM7688_02284 [Shimia marina]SFD88606.1 hypothetical protein SAMN04488037_10388 [Shimia marina]